MPLGPVEYILIAFPGNRFNGQIVPALRELVDHGLIHIIDLLFVKKDAAGNLLIVELEDAEELERAPFAELEGEIDDLLNREDIELAAAALPNNSSAGLLVWENVWAARFAAAVRAADGQVLAHERIPHAMIEAALEHAGIELSA
jgi:hypothetical protein